MRTVIPHRLGQVERYAAEYPDLELPPRHYREDLSPGDLAMLLEELPDATAPLWTEIEQVLGPGWYLGRTQHGEPLEFRAEHIADLEYTGNPSLGAWYDVFRPAAPRPRGPVTGAFRHFTPGARNAPPPPPPPRPASHKTKGSVFDVFRKSGSFFDLFKGRKTPQVEPIPPAERRQEAPRSFLRLPGQNPTPPSQSAPEPRQMAPQAQQLVPREAEAKPLVVQKQELPGDLFTVLSVPPRGERPGALTVPPAPSLPAQADAFSVLSPEPTSGSLSVPGASPFDILEDTGPQGSLVPRPAFGALSTSSVFDVLSPEEPAGMAIYSPPSEAPAEEKAPSKEEKKVSRPSEGKQRKSVGTWRMPSRESWVRWIEENFNLPELWKYLEEDRNSEYFLQAQESEEDSGQPAVLPIQTWAEIDWNEILYYFGIPREVYQPYLKNIDKAEEKNGYADEEWEEFQEKIVYPLNVAVSEAFESIKPKSLPGHIVVADDYDSGTFGLLYYEPIPPEESVRRSKEARQKQLADEKAAKEAQQHRKKELKRIWGPMPKAEDLVPWIEERFDLDAMFSDIKKGKRAKAWKEEKEYGDAVLPLEVVANIGPKRSKDYDYDVASYFGIPPDVVTLYDESDSAQELWEEVFFPFFESLRDAFSMLLPYADLPGTIEVDEDDQDQLTIQYREED